ncbi:MAG: 2Fe-2S iron-sulfur cluster-binding protein [Rhodobacteraceae bacterium]|nr:2Fe-2S iron-sulfur cluster-binding protein [Paracoccaceae bacterium]
MKVTWKSADGRAITADVKDGLNMMEAAVANNIPHVIGECGGSLSCATCHVYVDEAWAERVGQPERFEDGMLDVAEADRRPTSRLSCQIKASPALDGLVLHIPQP